QGDLSKLESGQSELRKLTASAAASPSGLGTPSSGGTPGSTSVEDPQEQVKELADSIKTFRTALERNDVSTMLREQGRIVELTNQLDQQFRNLHNPSTDQLRGALSDVGNGLG